MAGQKKVLIRNISLDISDREIGAAIKEFEENIFNNNSWKIGTINVKELNNFGKAKKTLQWIKKEEFDFVVITETKLILLKEKEVFFGSEKYHAFWESSIEKQMGTGVGILVKKCWTYHIEIIKVYYGRLLHLVLKFRSKISVYIVGLYMSASKLTTKKAVTKKIRKLLANIVLNNEIVIVTSNLNEDLTSKLLEKTFATNKRKKCFTMTML
ncbi:hypothetical protein G9A89_015630 [Geosiphon pyriformis]|nr:hypothetical protein G9A89_015630 [Geosiphon pyriformis]